MINKTNTLNGRWVDEIWMDFDLWMLGIPFAQHEKILEEFGGKWIVKVK